MLAGGYLKVESVKLLESVYTLSLTNQEIKKDNQGCKWLAEEHIEE